MSNFRNEICSTCGGISFLPVDDIYSVPCPTCGGMGMVRVVIERPEYDFEEISRGE